MNLQDYQIQAARTMNKSLPYKEQLAVLALGIVGEFGEVLEVITSKNFDVQKTSEELGDTDWYIANMYTLLDKKWEVPSYLKSAKADNQSVGEAATSAMIVASKLADSIKKSLGQGHPLNETRVVTSLELLTYYVNKIAEKLGLSSSDIRSENIGKLLKRYPEGFDANKSINR